MCLCVHERLKKWCFTALAKALAKALAVACRFMQGK